jgi:predicted TIM-barrel fold metal-dependent hydrolase
MRSYNVISSDDHVEEPKDTWQSRVPAKLRDRAPRVVRVEDGDAWEINGVRGRTIGLEAQAGKKFEDYKASGESYDTIRKGSYDPHERLKDMDIDGVDAQTLFPNVGLGIFGIEDTELQFACIHAYNDFLSDFASADPARLIGIGLIPTDDVEVGVKEVQHVAKKPGLRGVMLPTYPRGEPLNSKIYDPIWAAAQDLGLPVHVHLRTGDRRTAALFKANNIRGAVAANLNGASLANYEALSQIIFGGVLELFPRLKFVSVEGNIGWLGYFLEKSDRTYKRHRHWTKLDLPKPPSEYFHRQVYATFIEDKIGVKIRKDIGVDNLMWSSDYPHTDTTWPNSKQYIADTFEGVSEEDKYKMVAGNAKKVYNLS